MRLASSVPPVMHEINGKILFFANGDGHLWSTDGTAAGTFPVKKVYGEKGAIAWGSQIRSYVLDDRRVKDHRTNVETTNVESVLDRGDLDKFIDAELRRRKKAKK